MASENEIVGFKRYKEDKPQPEPGGFIEYPKYIYINGVPGPYIIVESEEAEREANTRGYYQLGGKPKEPEAEKPVEPEKPRRGRHKKGE